MAIADLLMIGSFARCANYRLKRNPNWSAPSYFVGYASGAASLTPIGLVLWLLGVRLSDLSGLQYSLLIIPPILIASIGYPMLIRKESERTKGKAMPSVWDWLLAGLACIVGPLLGVFTLAWLAR